MKDLFTCVNLGGGVLGSVLAVRGEPKLAAYAIIGGFLFGDALDGPVARLTKTGNRFGAEFDSAADHMAQGIAPAIVVFSAFAVAGHALLGAALMIALVSTASIRQARFNTAKFDYPLCYCGLPRTVSGLIAVSLPNSTLFFENSGVGYGGAAAVVFAVAALNLAPIPYMTHKGRKMQFYVKVLSALFLGSPVIAAAVPVLRPFTFDLIFIYTFGYAIGAWIPLRTDERKEYWAKYQEWTREISAAS